MHPSDLLGFEPRYFNFSDLQKPSDPSQSYPLSRLLDEFPFWGIEGEVRPSIYSTINGVVLYETLGSPEKYTDFIEEIGVEIEPLASFSEAIEERYSKHKADLDRKSVPNSEVISFIHVTQEFAGQISEQSPKAEIQSWCGVFYAMGLHAAHTNTTLANDLLSKRHAGQCHGESYIFGFIRNVLVEIPGIDEEHPLDRFLSYCYSITPVEREFIVKRLLPEVHAAIVANDDEASLAHVFMRCHERAAEIARDEPNTLQKLLLDIARGISPETVQSNLDLVTQFLEGPESYPWSFSELWTAGREIIDQQHPTLLDSLSGHANRIAELSYFQRMVDFAIWAGFVGAAPEAFRNFSMEVYNRLADSAPDRIQLN